MDNFNLVKEFVGENWVVLLLAADSRWSEICNFDWSTSLFKLVFPIITDSYYPIQISSECVLLAVSFGPVEVSLVFLASKFWYCKISKKCFRYWFISIVKHIFLSKYKLLFVHQVFYQKPPVYGRLLNLKMIVVLPRIGILKFTNSKLSFLSVHFEFETRFLRSNRPDFFYQRLDRQL